MDILELFRDMESDRVERKSSAADLDKIRQAVCAYGNDLPNHRKPGIVLVGQKDDGTCANIVVDDDLLLRLSQIRDDGKILPFPNMNVTREMLDGCQVASIVVQPSDNTPVRFDNRIWIRVGPRRAMATPDEERRLVEKRRWGNLPFDAHGVPLATLDDLNLARFEIELVPALVSPEAFAENSRSTEQKLRSLRFVDQNGVPTVTALLIFGKEPTRWFPGAYVEARRLDGAHLTDRTIDHREIGGSLVDQVLRLDEWLNLNIANPVNVGGRRRVATSDYPIAALRQLARNAIMHRTYEGSNAPIRVTWYSDRIEISSPGGPFGQVNEQNFGKPEVTDYRNPTLAGIFKALDFVEKFGVGIQIARNELRKNGNPPPEFIISPTHVHVVVKARQ